MDKDKIMWWAIDKLYKVGICKKNVESLNKHWSRAAIVTDFKTKKFPVGYTGKEVPKAELLKGELFAVTFEVGCYIVRFAQRVYNVYECGYMPEKETPAEQADVELVRKDMGEHGMFGDRDWKNRLRVTREVSAKYKSDKNGEFIYICRAAQARHHMWHEEIRCICAAKKHPLLPNNKAELFVCNTYEGDSFCADTWFKFSPSGEIKTLHLHPYDSNKNTARFE